MTTPAEDARREAELRAHPHIKGGVLEFVFRLVDAERAESEGLRTALVEARRLIGFMTNAKIGEAGRLLDAALSASPSPSLQPPSD